MDPLYRENSILWASDKISPRTTLLGVTAPLAAFHRSTTLDNHLVHFRRSVRQSIAGSFPMIPTITIISSDRCRARGFGVVPFVRPARSRRDAFQNGLRPDHEPSRLSDRMYRYFQGVCVSLWRVADRSVLSSQSVRSQSVMAFGNFRTFLLWR